MLVKKGSTDVSVTIRIVDSTDGTPETGVVWNTSGIDMQYRREGAASTAITEATLAALTTAHTDGGFLHIGNGYYRLDVPDAAFASGANGVLIHGTVTGMVVIGVYVQLTDVDIFDGVRGGMTALPNAAADAAGGLPISDAGGLDLDALNTAAVRLTAARAQIIDDWVNGGRLDLILDTIAADTTTDIPATLATISGYLDTEIAAILEDTGTIIPGLIATAQADLDIITDTDGVVLGAAGVDLIWNELVTGHTTNNSTGKILKGISEGWISAEGSVNDVSATTTGFITDLTSVVDNFYNDTILVFITGSLKGQSRPISTYTGATKTVTFDEALTSAPANTDQFLVLNGHTHPVSSITADIDANSTQLAAIVADTNELQTDDIPATLATIAGYIDTEIAAIKVDTAAILIDTNELQGDWTNGGRLDLIIDAILADTGTDGVVLTAAERIAIADALLDRNMATGVDSGSATVRTVRQALRSNRNKVSISGGTMTVTKEDDTTASWTAAVTTTAGNPISAIDPADA